MLIYIRTRLVDRMRQQIDEDLQPGQPAQQQQQGEAQLQPPPPGDLGLFPPVGDPARDEWAVVR